MSLENLEKVREYLVKQRDAVAAEAADDIERGYEAPAKKTIQALISVQETIEKVDRAIADTSKPGSYNYGLLNNL
ncbi:hypothetical protein [Agrobacterium tumefaciens]|uniref:hypothetical protein n=1 Tax=Agrobacterium tumefaciens TaxID=358 RepID=UPI0015734E1C|nr:hypothetical protein [Agrobacterium tumefaciens]NTD88654.1 hypothetical protein [Agrobacterium tumefaciens]NTD91383.1 hypothetical protein [Agrobacterium tumefaciens]NTD98830.1 hypothetical protein [Agrobacterium tumefaciens]NTE12211.1 hypothetical protein [Agrobacterium tumefaciens]NTE20288.1 hypothetical protein [Agrobacterium tumefaciens]